MKARQIAESAQDELNLRHHPQSGRRPQGGWFCRINIMALVNVKQVAEADFPSRWGHFRIHGVEGNVVSQNGQPAEVESLVALVMGDVKTAPPLARIHSQCLTGDVFGSLRCDCRLQLELALKKIGEVGAGILLYEKKEGRGIGLMNKLKAYALQDNGLDTVEANVELGFAPDCRDYEMPVAVLKVLGVSAIRLMTNNPEKVSAVESAGIKVVERVSAEVVPLETFSDYVRTKQEKMGHISDSLL